MPAKCMGIGGVSQAGKSALAGRLATACSDRTVTVLALDDFCLPESELPLWTDNEGREFPDWEHPSSVDVSRLTPAIDAAMKLSDLVIAEGILLFHHREINKRFDQRILLEVDEATYFDRRRNDLRRGTPSEAYLKHVWDAYWENKKGLDLEDVYVFRSSNPADEAFEFLVR
ncbi:MAG: hypothetical protein J4F31_06415 [Flavobacteriales bacterium]|nr:hypothetical protein [Flavobacteriales bacterium]